MILKSVIKYFCIIYFTVISCSYTQTLTIYLKTCDSLKKITELTNDPKIEARLYNSISETYAKLAITDSINKYAGKALKVAEQYNLKEEKAWAYVWLANCSIFTFSRNNFYYYCPKAYEIFKELNNKKGIIKTLILNGNAHISFPDKSEGYAFSDEALKMLDLNPDPYLLMEALSNIAQQYYTRKMYTKSDSLYRVVRSLTFEYPDLIRRVQNNSRHTYPLRMLGKTGEAIRLMQENIEIIKMIPNSFFVFDTYSVYAMILIDADRADEALIYINKAFLQPGINTNPELIRILYINKVNAFVKLGRFKEAYYAKLDLSEYECEKNNQLDNEYLSIKNQAAETQYNKDKAEIYLILFSSLAAILLMTVLYLINRYRQNTKHNFTLEEKVKSRTKELFDMNIQLNEEISYRKRAENILAESEDKYKSLFHNNHSTILLIDPDNGNIVDANSAACDYYGWTIDQITSMKILDINTLSAEEIVRAMNEANNKSSKAFFFKHRLADGTVKDVEVFSGPITIGGKSLLYSIVHDITDKIAIESALKDSEEKYRNLVENSMVGVLRIKANGDIIFANKAIATMMGYDNSDDLIKIGIAILYKDSNRRSDLLNQLKEHGRVDNFEMNLISRTGLDKIFLVHGVINGEIMDCTLVDITERDKFEKELVESENRLNRAEIAAKIGNWKLLLDSKQMFSSIGARIVYGIDKDIMSLEDIQKIPLPEYREFLDKSLVELIDNGIPLNIEYKICRPNDRKIIDIHSIADYDKENNIIFGVVHDITERRLAEAAIQRSELFVKDILNSLTAQIAVLDKDGVIININDAWKKFALSNNCPDPDFYLGVNYLSICENSFNSGYSTVEPILKGARSVLDGKLDQFSTEYPCHSPQKQRWFTLTVLPQNKPRKGLIIVHQDISERKFAEIALQDSETRYRLISENTADVIWIMNPITQKFTYISPSVKKLRGYTPEEIMVQPVGEALTPESRINVEEEWKKGLVKFLASNDKNMFTSTEVDQLCKDGSTVHTEVISTYMKKDNGEVEILGVSRDITERKKAEKEIVLKNNDLLKLNSEKDKFFSIIAHDLKSPFQGLIGYSEILTRDYKTLSEEEKLSLINGITELSNSSYKLLENLLDWARIQTGKMIYNPEYFNLLVELYPTISLLKQTAKNKKIEFHNDIDSSIFINADRNMLSTIVRNLVSNAIKFTNHGGRITLHAEVINNIPVFFVRDTGIGIGEEDLDTLFRIDKNKNSKGTANEVGTGLGLLLCKEMVEKHGGRIWVESKENVGSTFYFTIPDIE